MVIRGNGECISPCIYLNDMYERYQEGYPLNYMANEVADLMKEIVFIDEETLTKDEMQNAEQYETAENRMKKYHDKMEEMNGKTEE